MHYLFYTLLTLLLLQGLFSLREGFRFLAFVRRSLREPLPHFSPKASIILPCKGAEAGLEDNLRSLFQQQYSDYEVIFVVATIDDKAIPVIEKVIKEQNSVTVGAKEESVSGAAQVVRAKSQLPKYPTARLVIAGKSDRRSEKVNNLLCGLDQASHTAEVFIFVDSDARVRKDWLRSLITPLADHRIGATTGYRWYLPSSSTRRDTFFSALLSAWNGSVATTLGDHNNNFAWGGSTAIRRQIFEQTGVRDTWNGALSDDYALTRAVRKGGLRIAFVPRCMTVTCEDATLSSLLEFTTRQVIITRIYNARLWWLGLVSQLFFTMVFFGGLAAAILRFSRGQSPVILLALLASIYLLGAAKGLARMLAARHMLPQEQQRITRLWWAYCFLWVLVSVIYSYNFIRSATSRRILWRGIQYDLRSPEETVVLDSTQ